MKITGKYTDCDIFAKTLEDGIYSQIYDIINSKAFKDKKVCVMPDGHVGASGPCGLVAQIGDYVCPEHVGVDIGCEISAMFLNDKVKAAMATLNCFVVIIICISFLLRCTCLCLFRGGAASD